MKKWKKRKNLIKILKKINIETQNITDYLIDDKDINKINNFEDNNGRKKKTDSFFIKFN